MKTAQTASSLLIPIAVAACSPDGRKLIYTQQVDHSLALWISDIDGGNARALIDEGMNLLPSWLPDSQHIVWMKTQPGKDPSRKSQIHLMNTDTGESRRLFSSPEQLNFSNSMPVVSPRGDLIAFVSNRSGEMRIWVSALDGSNAKLVSVPEIDFHEAIEAPIEQKVPAWSPDGKWIAHWEGVEMGHMSKFTGVPKIVIETKSGEKELPIVPSRRNWGRFTWLPDQARMSESEQAGDNQSATAPKSKNHEKLKPKMKSRSQ